MNQSSGDLRADRRFLYAQQLLREGDREAAADLFRQTIDSAPGWPAAWFGLGQSLEEAGDRPAAIAAYRRTLALAPDDALGAAPRLARLGAGHPGPSMSTAYVRTLFDQYADRFDEHLLGILRYRGPEIILAALQSLRGTDMHFGSALDMGCGTGLMAAAIRSSVDAIDGVDLSPAMIEKAKRLDLYRSLRVCDLAEVASPAGPQAGAYDLVLAADALVYCGDLAPAFAAAAHAMTERALFAFTIEALDGDGYRLGEALRYQHSRVHVDTAVDAAGLEVAYRADCVTREEKDVPAPGQVVVLRKRHG